MARSEEYQRKERELFKEIIVNNEELTSGTFLLSVKRRFHFLPGQVIKMSLDKNDTPRIYSICSGDKDEYLKILYTVKEGGHLTPQLAKQKAGDTVYISKPYGGFTGTDEPAWWIATGTGIAPFYSMLRSGQYSQKKLIHGVRFVRQFYFEKEFVEALDKNYIRCCTREDSEYSFKGRVTDYLEKQELPENVLFYICGKALMVVEVRDLLISKGIDYDHIIAEIYF